MEKSDKKFKFIFERLLELEKSKNLYFLSFNDVYFYKLLRFELYHKLLKKNNLINDYQKTFKVRLKEKINIIKIIIFNFLKDIFYKEIENCEIYIVDHDRFFIRNSKLEGIYTFKLIEQIEKEKRTYEIEYPLGTPLKNKKKSHKKEGLLFLFKLFLIQIKKISLQDKKLLTELLKELGEYKIEIEIKKLYIIIKKFKLKKEYYKKYFKQKKVKKVYMICSYGKEYIIAAAQELGIEVIEIQHGNFSKYHLGYNFQKEKVPYVPDKILTFSKYWNKKISDYLPINMKCEIYGYPYVKEQIERYKTNRKKQIVFISQMTIAQLLIRKAIEFAIKNPNIEVIYRFHPTEAESWETLYPVILQYKNLNNFKLSFKNNLYEILCESEYLIGGYSTVIYEALEAEVKVGVIKTYGFEYMKDLVEENLVYAFEEEEEIKIEKLEFLSKKESGYFFNNV